MSLTEHFEGRGSGSAEKIARARLRNGSVSSAGKDVTVANDVEFEMETRQLDKLELEVSGDEQTIDDGLPLASHARLFEKLLPAAS